MRKRKEKKEVLLRGGVARFDLLVGLDRCRRHGDRAGTAVLHYWLFMSKIFSPQPSSRLETQTRANSPFRGGGGKRSVWQPTSLPTWHWRSRGLEGWTDRVVEYVDRGERGRANLQWCKSKREVRKDMTKGEEFLYKYIFVCSFHALLLLYSRRFINHWTYSCCDYFLKIHVSVTVKKKKEREEDKRRENAEGKRSNIQVKRRGE